MMKFKYKYLAKTIIFCVGILCMREAFAGEDDLKAEGSDLMGPKNFKTMRPKCEWKDEQPQGKQNGETNAAVPSHSSNSKIWGPVSWHHVFEKDSIFENAAATLRYRWP